MEMTGISMSIMTKILYANNKSFKYDAKHPDLNPEDEDSDMYGIYLEDWDKWPASDFDPLSED